LPAPPAPMTPSKGVEARPAPSLRLTSVLLLLVWASAVLATVLILTVGFAFHLGNLPLRAHGPLPAFIVAVACAAAACRHGPSHVAHALVWWWALLERRAAMLAGGAALAAMAIGLAWGTYVAGGPDSYCYLNQAELLASGRIREPQPIVRQVPWPKASITFTPVGHLPAAGNDAAIVPACPAGYPVLMAAARVIGGRTAMFWVVPLLGGLAVWLTFLLGRRFAGAVAGSTAAVLLASSPTFLYQIVQPMTDVPAVALWTAALVAALRRPSVANGLISGFLTGAALLVRPNLVPLAGVLAISVLVPRPISGRAATRTLAAFALGLIPFMVAILALNSAMHGSPLESGYGRLRDLFTIQHIVGNLERYPVWLVETQTPFVLLAFVAPWIARSMGRDRLAWWLLAFSLMTFACYIPYTVWDAWWFLRFVLPAFPPLLVLSAAVALAGMSRIPPAWRTIAFASMMTVLVGFQIFTAANRAVFQLRDLEARFRDAGEYVARRLPTNAIVFAVTESGSVRFYSGRPTLFWSALDSASFEPAIEFLNTHGYRPYFLFESDEEPLFREQFGRTNPLADLDWPPLADINRQVRIYDPGDRAVYLHGGKVVTDVVWTQRR
jgi:hypothetical protein